MKQHPSLIQSASLFNPVVSAFSMWTGSTLPDWVKAEIGGNNDERYDFKSTLTDLEAMKYRERSPLFGDYNFKSKLMIFNGLKDDVVPPLATRHFYKKLKSQGLDVQLYEYPTEEHYIFLIGPNFDYIVKTALLLEDKISFEKHTQAESS